MKRKAKEINLVYTGYRLDSQNKKSFVYKVIGTEKDFLYFGRRVGRFEIIGNTLTCNLVKEGTYNNFKVVDLPAAFVNISQDDITFWFAQQRASTQELKMIQLRKQERPESLEVKVKVLQKSLEGLTRVQKNDVALWVYSQLLK